MKITTIFAGLFLAIVTAGCADDSSEKKKKSDKKPHLVESYIVAPVNVSASITRLGTLTAEEIVEVVNQEEGIVTKLPYHEGDQAKKGDLIIELDARLIKAQLKKADAQLTKAKSDLNRINSLFKSELASQEQLIDAETTHASALAEVNLLRTRLSYTRIKAPFDGVITHRLIEPGNVAERFTHLLTLVNPDVLVTQVDVSELIVNNFRVGDTAQLQIDALRPNTWEGRIKRIHPTIDPNTRTSRVEIEMPTKPVGARPGQLVTVTLQGKQTFRNMIPFRALRHSDKKDFVFLIDQGQVTLREVTIGLNINEQVEIVDGLNQGDAVVVKGFLGLKPGKKIEVVNQPDKPT